MPRNICFLFLSFTFPSELNLKKKGFGSSGTTSVLLIFYLMFSFTFQKKLIHSINV